MVTRRLRYPALLGALCLTLLVGSAASATPLASPAPGQAAPRGAGLVIRHGDGSLVYAFIPFDQAQISGADLLQRSSLALTVTTFAGLGVAVCSLDHEGCPASNCFCRSYGTPAVYWRYYLRQPDGTWQSGAAGPSSVTVHPGDLEAWVWGTADDLPPATDLETVERLAGVLPATPVPSLTTPAVLPHGTSEPSAVAAAPIAAATTPQAVVVAPNGEVRPIQPAAHRSGPDTTTIVLLAGTLTLVALAGAGALWRRSRAGRQP